MKLARMLQQAHAIEIGAYHAYEGHCKSLPIDSDVRRRIRIIQNEEFHHRSVVYAMLRIIDSKPDPILDTLFLAIGKTISIACRVMSRKMAMFGAKIMERLGDVCYARIAAEARRSNLIGLALQLERMQKTEKEHETFFKEQL